MTLRPRRRCSVVTLDAKQLVVRTGLLFSDGPKFALDWADSGIVQGDAVVKTAAERPCALFDQLSSCLRDLGGQGEACVYRTDGRTTRWIVFVDFSSLFKGGLRKASAASAPTAFDAAARLLVEGGFCIRERAGGGQRLWHYSIFDKSSNQARHSIVSFVADVGYIGDGCDPVRVLDSAGAFAGLDERLRLGIDFGAVGAEWSKYFAYRGLYLSSATRIADPALLLDEETVLVLGPMRGQVAESQAPKGVLRVVDEGGGWALEPAGDLRSPLSLFDGEGLVCPEYARVIRSCLGRGGAATSFQVRMPFAKGMLHEVDFQRFLREEAGIGPGARIVDAFGIARDLGKVKVVLTAEMLKCLKWLQEWVGGQAAVSRDDSAEGPHACPEARSHAGSHGESQARPNGTPDPMAYYFQRFHAYGHALYVSGTNAGLDRSGKTELNGQFLSTLHFSRSDFDAFAKQHMEEALRALDDPCEARRLLLGHSGERESAGEEGDADEAAESAPALPGEGAPGEGGAALPGFDGIPAEAESGPGLSGDAAGGHVPTWKLALAKSRRFIDDPFIRREAENAAVRKLLKCSIGNIEVDGALLYLSHDLLRLLVDMARNAFATSADACAMRNVEAIRACCIEPDRFFSPFVSAQGTDPQSWFAVLRNPHLSRSEQCALRRHRDRGGLYETYFGGLAGVVMVACDSAAPTVLGGADYDGDLVRVIWDGAVVSSVLEGAYEQVGGGSHARRYPVVDMEGPAGAHAGDPAGNVGARISYEQLRRTFSSHVGEISNSAMRKAREAYGAVAGPQGACPALPETDGCAIYSVATGMEIDAVKTGADLRGHIGGIYVERNDAVDVRDRLGYISYKKDVYPGLSRNARALLGEYRAKAGKVRRTGDAVTVELAFPRNGGIDAVSFGAMDFSKADSDAGLFKGRPVSNIDRLPWLLMQVLGEHAGAGVRPRAQGADVALFTFEAEDGWPEDAGPARSADELAAVMESYREVRSRKRAFDRNRLTWERRNDFAKACSIARRRPHASAAEQNDSEATLRLAAGCIEDYLLLHAGCDIGKLVEGLGGGGYAGWAFLAPARREAFLQGLMPGLRVNGALRRTVLENPQRDGFMLLFYLFRTVQRELMLNAPFEAGYFDALGSPDGAEDAVLPDERSWVRLVQVTQACAAEKLSAAEWDARVVESLRERFAQVLGRGTSGLAEHLCLLRRRGYFAKGDETRLFWSLLKWEDVERFIDECDPVPPVARGGAPCWTK